MVPIGVGRSDEQPTRACGKKERLNSRYVRTASHEGSRIPVATRVFALLVAAIFALGLMPTGALGATSDVTVTITYDANGGVGTINPATATTTIPANSTHVLYELPGAPTGVTGPSGKLFLGWSEAANGTPVERLDIQQSSDNASGTSFTLAKTVYALWGDDNNNNGVADTLETTGDNQSLDNNNGSITINNSISGETYTAYQLFQLYSWTDNDVSPDQHQIGSEAYSYYIANGPTDSDKHPLYDWLKNYSYDSSDSTKKAFEFDEANQVTIGSKSYVPVKASSGFLDLNTISATGDNFLDENTEVEYQSATGAQYQEFARAAMNAINSLGADAKAGITKGTAAGDGDDVTISNLPLGYYLVDSTLGSLCALDTTNANVTIVEKNELTTVTKTVKEDGGSEQGDDYGDKNDADFGQEVEYTTTLTIPLRQSNVVFHDTMYHGIKLKPSTIEVKVDGTALTAQQCTIYDSDATDSSHAAKDGDVYASDTFAVEFANAYTEALTADTPVTITYKATLDPATAIVGKQLQSSDATTPLAKGDGNDNVCKATYGKAQSTEEDWTRTYTWDFDIFKHTDLGTSYSASNAVYAAKTAYVDAAGNPNTRAAALAGYIRNPDTTDTDREDSHYWVQVKPLAGATFQLKKGSDTLHVVQKNAGSASAAAVYRYTADSTETGATQNIVTPASGLVVVEGLDADTYALTETVAPTGYNKLKADVPVIIDSDTDTAQGADNTKQTTITLDYKTDASTSNGGSTYGIVNQTGPELPSTGGIGTTIFYVVGGILVAGSAVLLITKKRMSTEA